MKCTHDSGGIAICKDKEQFDYSDARNRIIRSLKCNYYSHGREWPYKDVPPKVIAEEYLGDSLNDYKFFCFNGKVKCFKIDLIDLQIIMQTIMIAMEIYFRSEKQSIFRYLKKRLRCQKN